jgi:hypothetical protein
MPDTSTYPNTSVAQSQARLQEATTSNRQGQRVTAEEFELSDEENEADDLDQESDMSHSGTEDHPKTASVDKHHIEGMNNRRRRVTLLVQDPTSDDDAEVLHPRLRLPPEQNPHSTSRRVSAIRAEYAVSDTQLTFRNDADGNPTSTILMYTNVGDESFYEDDSNVIDSVEDKDQLIKSVADHPEAWFTAISKYIDVVDTLMDESRNASAARKAQETEISSLRRMVQLCESNHGTMEMKLADCESTIEKARGTVARLRAERSDARRDNRSKSERIRKQELLIASLQEAANEARAYQKRPEKHARTDFDLSDDSSSNESDKARKPTIKRESLSTPRRHSPIETSVNPFTPSAIDPSSHNPRYPDIGDYHGKPNEDLEQWTAAADTKFARSWANFPTEWSKIEYLRDHCKGTAYSVVKLRALRRSETPYKTVEELISDLEMNFGMSNEDRKAAALQKLVSGDCKQKMNEGASEWLARYNLIATEAQLDQATRRFYALQNLNSHYKGSATQNARIGESWSEFSARLRQLEKDLAAAYGNGKSNINSNGIRKRDGKESSRYRSKEQFKIISDKKLCVRCLKPGHIMSSPDAPCRNKKDTPWDKSLEVNAVDTRSEHAGNEPLKE